MNKNNLLNQNEHSEFVDLFYAERKPLFDILVVKEKTGGIYKGERGRLYSPCGECMGKGCQEAYDTEKYSWVQIERALRAAYECAGKRKKKLCIADKADELESSLLWREVAQEISAEYPEIETSYLYIEEAVMQIFLNPGLFDVIVTSNLFGDILCAELTALTDSQAVLPLPGLNEKMS